jgi:hypothetical protein
VECSPAADAKGATGICEGGRRQWMGRKVGSGSSGLRCSGSSPAPGRGKTDAVGHRDSLGSTGLSRGHVDATNQEAGGGALLRAVRTVFSM